MSTCQGTTKDIFLTSTNIFFPCEKDKIFKYCVSKTSSEPISNDSPLSTILVIRISMCFSSLGRKTVIWNHYLAPSFCWCDMSCSQGGYFLEQFSPSLLCSILKMMILPLLHQIVLICTYLKILMRHWCQYFFSFIGINKIILLVQTSACVTYMSNMNVAQKFLNPCISPGYTLLFPLYCFLTFRETMLDQYAIDSI